MLKILINNEEVVCDKQLEIKEEMLATSSCILNNCYPKSWENTKDYTSQYYYPKDYSKCVIKDEVNVPAEEGEYATGTNLNINVDNTKEWSYQLEGDTQQNTTILPSGYTQVDYIHTTNNSYIDTGYKPNANTNIKMKITISNGTARPFGVLEGNVGYLNNVGYWRIFATGGQKIEPTGTYDYEIQGNKVYRDGELIYTGGTPISFNYNLFLFASNQSGTPNYGNNGYLYYFKIYDNDVLVRDFIPCYRNSDNVVGLYDIVNNMFYTNQGTGTFTYGRVVDIPNPDYPQDINVVTGEQNVTISQNSNTQNYPINLGKNLFDKDNANIIYGWFDTNTTVLTSNANTRTLYIKCLPNTTYTITKIVSQQFNVGCTNNLPSIGTIVQKVETGPMGNYDSNVKVNYTYTTNNTAQYLLVRYAYSTQVDLDLMISSIQIEKGNVATEYASYITPIELCKIGDYQDYIYNQNGEWYLHKEIGKVILNGGSNENWTYQNNHRFWLNWNYFSDETIAKNFSGDEIYGLYCNKFKEVTRGQTWAGVEGISYDNPSTRGSTFDIACNSVATTVNDFKTWLSNNPLEVVYILQNPQDIQITDTALIQQLDNLKNATLFNGVNNISVDGDLPTILNLHYNFVTARTDTTLLFSGVVKNTGNINLNPRYPHYCNLEVLDFKTFLSECDQLDFVISDKTVTQAIEQVTETISSYGFVVGDININDDTIIGAYSTQEKTPYDVFQYLADISQSRWYTRLIDENTVAIDFYDPVAMQRGVDLDFSNNEFTCQNNIEDLSFNYGTYDYRNKQIMLSDQVFGGVDYNERIIADGYAKTFTIMSNIGILQSIYVDGIEKSYATQDEKEAGLEADFYYTPGSNTLESNENDGTYPAGSEIEITYTPLIKGRQVISNADEINRINSQTGRNGVIARYENRNDVLSNNELNLVGQSYIKYKGTPEINVTLITKDIDLYNIGQIVYFNYPNIEELNQDYMVKSKRTKIINTATDWNIWYTYTLTSNFNSETAINYFDNQRAKASGNIQSGDYITRNIDIEQTALIVFKNASATEITIDDDNILNAPLNAPFTQ